MKYINSRGETLDLSATPYLLQSGDLFDYSWSYDLQNNQITNIRREAGERAFKICIIPDETLMYHEKRQKLKEAIDNLYDVIEYDVVNNASGKLMTENGWYFPCIITANSKSDWEKALTNQFIDLTAVSALNSWILPVTFEFYAGGKTSAQDAFLDYKYDYDYDYTPNLVGVGKLVLNHVDKCNFQLIIFGPVTNPRITIAGHIYQVNTTIEEGEYLTVDSRDNTIVLTQKSGTKINQYDLRYKNSTVFEPILPGNSEVNWNGSFGFTLTIYEQRSEPRWS